MKKKDFLSITDLSLDDARKVFSVTKTLKEEPKGRRMDLLRGRSIAIVLEKPSTRTRVSFEVGISQLGGHPVVLSTEGSQLGRGEPIKDTARVLARYCEAIVFRTSSEVRLREMATASVPVVNALSDEGHPVQVLCDIFTMEEEFARQGDSRGIAGRRVAFVGDCSSNMARSFLQAAPLFGFQLVLAGPKGYLPSEEELRAAGSHVVVAETLEAAIQGADVVHTDVWTSMGQEAENALRLERFRGWTLTEAAFAHAPPGVFVMHCLPAHRGEEIDEPLLEGPRSRVWDQSENRLHVQKGLLCFLLGLDV